MVIDGGAQARNLNFKNVDHKFIDGQNVSCTFPEIWK